MKKIFLMIFMLLVLTGCYDGRDITEMAYVTAIGIDSSDRDGLLNYTFQFVNPNEDNSLENLSASAGDIYSAMDKANYNFAKEYDYSQLKIIVLSDKLKNNEFKNQLNTFLYSPKFHNNVLLAVSSTEANSFLKSVNPSLDAMPTKYYDNIFKPEYTAYAPEVRIKDYNLDGKMHKKYMTLPLVNERISGMAIIGENGVKHETDGKEALYFHLINEKVKNLDFEIIYEGERYLMSLTSCVPPVKRVNLKGGDAILSVEASYDAKLLWAENNGRTKEDLEKIAAYSIENHIKDFLYKCSREYRADICGFSDIVKRKYLTQKNWEAEDWEGLFENGEYNVFVKVNITKNE